MLRGVNKQIIEINSTDNCYFEKAILFVRPEFSETSETKLRDNASEFLKDIENEKQLIKKYDAKKEKLKINKKIVYSILITIGIVAVSVGVILKVI